MRAAVTEVCVTPPIGVELAGYGPRLDRYSTDVHDHLLGQALVLDDGRTKVAFITVDALGLSPEVTSRVRQEVARRTDIPAGNVMLAASHSHTSPPLGPTRDWGMPDEPYVTLLERHLAGAAVASAGKLQPATLRLGASAHPDLAWNRTGEPLVDPTVMTLVVEDETGQARAIVVHYACHPVMLGPKSEISADYPGALRRHLQVAYPGAVVMFANGACGDIDPATNREVWGKATFEDVDRAGAALARAAQTAVEQAQPMDETTLRVQQGSLTLPYAVPALDTVRAAIQDLEAETGGDDSGPEKFEEVTSEVRIPRFWLRYWRAIAGRLETGAQPSEETAELQIFHFGDALVMIAIPAEVYTEQGLQLRSLSPGKQTMAVCYANGMVGYLPTEKAFAKGSYAATLAAAVFDRVPFQSHVSGILVDSVRRMLEQG